MRRVVSAIATDFVLPRGTRLSVLDLKVERDQVRNFTRTIAPVRLADGKRAYGCTEFVFPWTRAYVVAAMSLQ